MGGRAKPEVLDPVAAYDAFAPFYAAYSAGRSCYLKKIEAIVIAHARGAQSLLDVGAGDGKRALRIAESLRIRKLVLLEPSAAMRAQCHEAVEFWDRPASRITEAGPSFDVITCLWNVLGHLADREERVDVLSKLKALLNPAGAIFLDVHHRYNAAAYGWTKTLLRMMHDWVGRSERHGDVTVSWQGGNRRILTYGHVFTQAEMDRLFRDAGLRVEAKWIVDYGSGGECKSPFRGNLLYQLQAP